MGGNAVKKLWQPMKLTHVGRVGDIMRGMQGVELRPRARDVHEERRRRPYRPLTRRG